MVQDAQVIDDLTVAELMALVGSASDLDVRVADLPAGSRRLVEVAAAAARHPRVLLLDEPTARLTADEIARFEAALGGDTMSIVIVEHDAALVSRIADRIVVLDTGRVVDSHYGSRRGL